MKYEGICVPIIIGVVCMSVSWISGDMGSLFGFICSGIFLLMLGIAFLMSAFILGKGTGKSQNRDVKFTLGMVILGCLFIFIGGKNLISAGIDSVTGPKVIYLSECSVSQTVSLRRISRSYYLEGEDPFGNERRFVIDKDTYNRYENTREFSVQLIGWEHCGVIQKIY